MTGASDRVGHIYNGETYAKIGILQGHTGELSAVQFSHDGSKIVTTSFDFTARFWNAETTESLFEMREHTNTVYGADISSDDSTIALASYDKVLGLSAGLNGYQTQSHPFLRMAHSWCRSGTRRQVPRNLCSLVTTCG